MGRGNVPDDLAIDSKIVSRAIRSAQSQVESRNAEIRKNVLKYDDVLNRQREAIYSDRRHILEGDDLQDRVDRFLQDVVTEVVDVHTADGNSEDWDFDAMWAELKTLYPVSITIDEVLSEAGMRGKTSAAFVTSEVLSDAKLAYGRREESLGGAAMRELERRVVLSVIDRRWRDHLYEMDYLKDGIGLRAMAQRDPLVEYQREGFALYQSMMGQIREEAVGFLFNLEVEVTGGGNATAVAAKGLTNSGAPADRLSYSAPNADAAGEVEVRNQRGQVEQAATSRARQAATLNPAFGGQPAAQQPAAARQQGQPGQPAQRGAFGQREAAPEPPPINRAQRRAQEKNKGR